MKRLPDWSLWLLCGLPLLAAATHCYFRSQHYRELAQQQYDLAEPVRADFRSIMDVGTGYSELAAAYSTMIFLCMAVVLSLGVLQTILQRHEKRTRRLEEELARREQPTP